MGEILDSARSLVTFRRMNKSPQYAGSDEEHLVNAIRSVIGEADSLADALRQIATAIGTPANVDPLADIPGLVMMVEGLVQRAESRDIRLAAAEGQAAAAVAEVRALRAGLARLTAHTEATSPEGIGGTSGDLA